ncbi:MAG: SIR2 family protein [Alphaproteobacteria bacterium]|nr:SIR2 family protein [Alphaproteobacteria bacterium]
MNLPVEVVDAARRDRCVLVVGARASAEAAEEAGQPYPSEKKLARALGGKGAVAEACADLERRQGRDALFAALRAQVGLEGVSPGAFHRAAVRRFPRIFTSAWDDLLERAAVDAGLEPLVAQRGEPVPDAQPGRCVIYRLRGGFSAPDALVLTHADARARPMSGLRRDFRRFLHKEVVFFVGYRPDEQDFEQTFEDFSEGWGGELPRSHLAVAQGRISDYHWQKWVWRGLLLFTADPAEALSELERQIHD